MVDGDMEFWRLDSIWLLPQMEWPSLLSSSVLYSELYPDPCAETQISTPRCNKRHLFKQGITSSCYQHSTTFVDRPITSNSHAAGPMGCELATQLLQTHATNTDSLARVQSVPCPGRPCPYWQAKH